MRKGKLRLLIALLTVVSLLLGISDPRPQSVQAKNADRLVYVALGDSIARGFGLPGYTEDSTPQSAYAALTRDALTAYAPQLDAKGVDFYNWAVNGMTSGGLLAMLNQLTKEQAGILSQADVITLSIGSNDLLLPFMQTVLGVFGVDGNADNGDDIMAQLKRNLSSYTPAQIGYLLSGLQAVLEDNAVLNAACDAFGGENGSFLQIIRKLKELAPQAEIFATNGYNPYYGVDLSIAAMGKKSSVLDMDRLSEKYIRKLNQAFSASSSEYTLVDVFDAFEHPNMTNVSVDGMDMAKLTLDPHPNTAGHQAIADRIRERLIQTLGLSDPVWLLSKIQVKPASKTLSVKKTAKVTVSLPKGLKKAEVTIRYQSSKPSVAAVSAKGKITAKKAGRAKITVTARLKDGSKKEFKIPVTVKKVKK